MNRADLLKSCLNARANELQALIAPAVLDALPADLAAAHREHITNELRELRELWREIEHEEARSIIKRARQVGRVLQIIDRKAA